MPLKREISASVANLQQSVKRLALAEEEKDHTSTFIDMNPQTMTSTPETKTTTAPYRANNILESVISTSRDDFDVLYEKLDEIGRGGFSTVHRCRNKKTQEIYAVKVCEEYFHFSSVIDYRFAAAQASRKIQPDKTSSRG